MSEYRTYYNSEIGTLEIVGTEYGIKSINYVDESSPKLLVELNHVLEECVLQLDEYFAGKRREFAVSLLPQKGTQFQNLVWNQLKEIPFGQTWSYQELAEAIGNPKAVRAVGNANSKNQLSIIIPCHRVIGSNGRLTGYAGGLWRKEWLLKHEGCWENK